MNGAILIAEKDMIIAEDIRLLLEKSGYRICDIVRSPEEALTSCQNMQPDLVLMSLESNNESEILQTARAIRSNVGCPVIFLSTIGQTESDFLILEKPFDQQELLIAVEEYMNGSAA